MKAGVLACLAAIFYALPAFANEEPGRLVYEIVVTNPGTRSQGWNGTLFGADGKALAPAPGTRVETPVGAFIAVKCQELWVPCGMIHDKTLDWMNTTPGNAILDGEQWSYRLFVSAEGTKSEGWTGKVLHAGAPVEPGIAPLDTPMGPYVRVESSHPWGWHGWIHQSWSALP